MIDGELDLGAMKAHWEAIAPMYMGDPSSVMYQIVVTDMGMLIDEVERLRKKYEAPISARGWLNYVRGGDR